MPKGVLYAGLAWGGTRAEQREIFFQPDDGTGRLIVRLTDKERDKFMRLASQRNEFRVPVLVQGRKFLGVLIADELEFLEEPQEEADA